ncbi:MAG: alpha/beta hydrolase, partial [Nanoarchaeota archaeon]|nr:alpha/beta hydrolase [Nanoarchaeota archaeon]
IIHGTGGNPQGNWFPWLKENLKKNGHIVFSPKFPTPENQSLKSWLETFEKYKKELDENTILIGHSLGPAFILNLLETISIKIKASILVAGFLGPLEIEFYDKLNKSFTEKEFNWKKIRNNCEQFYIINSKDDPYVPFQKGIEIANKLKTQVIPLEKAGHINEEFGFNKFEKILPYLKVIENQTKIEIKGEEGKLIGFKTRTKNPNNKAILLVHGFGVTKTEAGLFDENVEKLIELGFTTYRFDFRGKGESEGNYEKITLSKLKNDLEKIYAFIKKENFEKIGLFAHSFGVTSSLAANLKFEATVFIGSIANPKEKIASLFPNFNSKGISKRRSSSNEEIILCKEVWKDFEKYDLIKNLNKIKTPILFIHGTNDTTIPQSESELLFNKYNNQKELYLIENDDHNFTKFREKQIEKACKWFNKYL